MCPWRRYAAWCMPETQNLLQLFTESLMSHCRRTYNGMFKPCLAYTKLKPYSLSLSLSLSLWRTCLDSFWRDMHSVTYLSQKPLLQSPRSMAYLKGVRIIADKPRFLTNGFNWWIRMITHNVAVDLCTRLTLMIMFWQRPWFWNTVTCWSVLDL